jgi:anti-anti-sigma regulatory factor
MADMSAEENTIVLSERLEMSGAKELHSRLVEALKGAGPVVLDATGLTGIDSASAQVLVAFALSAKEAHVPLTVKRSAAFDEFFTQTALNHAFS